VSEWWARRGQYHRPGVFNKNWKRFRKKNRHESRKCKETTKSFGNKTGEPIGRKNITLSGKKRMVRWVRKLFKLFSGKKFDSKQDRGLKNSRGAHSSLFLYLKRRKPHILTGSKRGEGH